MLLTPNQQDLVDAALDWITSKIEASEGFSVLLVSLHSEGKKGTKYSLETVEEGLVACRADLQRDLSDASEYALVYDARIELEKGGVTPVFIVRTESRMNSKTVQCIAPYRLEESGGAKEVILADDPQLFEVEERWLLSDR